MDAAVKACPACLAAAVRMHHVFHSACKGCNARAIARGPDYHRVRTAGKLDSRYKRALDQIGITHADVKRAADADALGKGK